MLRAPWRRLLATLLAVWFTAYSAEPTVLVACPMHGRATVAPRGAHAVHHAGATAADVQHHAPSHPGNGDSHQCACMGDCSASAPVALDSIPAALVIAPLAPAPRTELPPVRRHASRVAEHTLPFATAPPLA